MARVFEKVFPYFLSFFRSVSKQPAAEIKIPQKVWISLLTFAGAYSIILWRQSDATVAQLVEQLIRNQQVAGSSPASSSTAGFFLKLAVFLFAWTVPPEYNKGGGKTSALIRSAYGNFPHRVYYRFLKYNTNCATAFPAQRASIKQEEANCISFALFTTPIPAQNTDMVKQIAAARCRCFFFKNKASVSSAAVLTAGISLSLS